MAMAGRNLRDDKETPFTNLYVCQNCSLEVNFSPVCYSRMKLFSATMNALNTLLGVLATIETLLGFSIKAGRTKAGREREKRVRGSRRYGGNLRSSLPKCFSRV